jgi:hypothetical protein
MHWKLQRAEYHAKVAREAWSKLDRVKGTVVVGGAEWNEAEFASTAETEASAQVIHSLLDVLAQIANKYLLTPPLDESDVSIWCVARELCERQRSPAVLTEMNTLLGSDEVKYVVAFVNTIKHRHLLDTDYRAERGIGTRNGESVRFKSFVYKGDSYPEVWAIDIVRSCMDSLVRRICAVGNEINKSLR